MKKIVLALITVVVATTLFAQQKQNQRKKDFRIGFMLEPTLSWFNPQENGIKPDGSKFGLTYGLMVDYEFSENYILSTGLQVSQLGGKLSYTGNSWENKKVGYLMADEKKLSNTANYSLNIQYIQIPFTIKLLSDNKGSINYWGSFGGFLGIPLKARADVETNFAANGMAIYKAENQNILSYTQPVNVGMQVGAGIEYKLSEKNILNVGLIFNNGFIDVTQNSDWGNDGRVNMNNLALKVGVFF